MRATLYVFSEFGQFGEFGQQGLLARVVERHDQFVVRGKVLDAADDPHAELDRKSVV